MHECKWPTGHCQILPAASWEHIVCLCSAICSLKHVLFPRVTLGQLMSPAETVRTECSLAVSMCSVPRLVQESRQSVLRSSLLPSHYHNSFGCIPPRMVSPSTGPYYAGQIDSSADYPPYNFLEFRDIRYTSNHFLPMISQSTHTENRQTCIMRDNRASMYLIN